MSLYEVVKGDMATPRCRLTDVCGAAWIDDNVARPARPERHDGQSMSPDPIVQSDMNNRASRPSCLGGATFATTWIGSPEGGAHRARVEPRTGRTRDRAPGVLQSRLAPPSPAILFS